MFRRGGGYIGIMKTFMEWLNESADRPRFIYTALKLDELSHNKLKDELASRIPEGWKVFCHHMTINLGDASVGPAADMVGETMNLTATELGMDDKVMAVKVVSSCPSNNSIKHVTVAVNFAGGGKPKDSNDLKNWVPLESPIELSGVVTVIG